MKRLLTCRAWWNADSRGFKMGPLVVHCYRWDAATDITFDRWHWMIAFISRTLGKWHPVVDTWRRE